MKKLATILVLSLSSVAIFSSQVIAVDASPIEWVSQFGTSSVDRAVGISADATGIYVAGYTNSIFPGQTGAGSTDIFVSRYNLDGTENWTRQFGTTSADYAAGISVDATGVYVTGYTYGAFSEQTSAGSADIFVSRYNLDGTENWTRQFGTGSTDYAAGISVDASGIYVAGHTSGILPEQNSAGFVDTFITKYNLDGTENWTRQFGTDSADYAAGISVDATGIYVTGTTYGIFPGQNGNGSADTFLSRYNLDGTENWTRQSGMDSMDYAVGISLDATGVYVAGYTYSDGSTNALVCKYNLDGTEDWKRQFGTDSPDYVEGISVDATGVYVVGYTNGVFPGQTSTGSADIFVSRYNLDGTENWTLQFGTDSTDYAAGISVDTTGMYLAGHTYGVFSEQTSEGGLDVFVLKFSASTNGLPVADAGAPYDNVYEGDTVILDGTGSDPYDGINLYEWDIDNDGEYDAVGETTTVVFNDNGVYEVVLKVTDSLGESDTDIAIINVGNKPPEVYAESDQPVYVGEPVTVNVEFKDEGIFDTHTTSISWGDGNDDELMMIESSAEGSLISSHVYTQPDIYEVTVTVTDNDFGVGSCVLIVEILLTPEEMVEAIIDDIDNMDLPENTEVSLNSSLDNVVKVLEDSKPQNDLSAINMLEAFISKVEAQRGKKISEEDAYILIDQALKIITSLSEDM